MKKTFVIFLSLILTLPAVSQQPTSPDDTLPSIRVATKLVLTDVVVTDKSGKAITDLKAEDFTVEESGKKQKIATFSSAPTAPGKPKDLLPNIYTNRPEYAMGNGPLTILVLDALNTAVQNQAYARQQLIKYVQTQLRPGQRVAVYGLTNHLIKLQNFTDDSQMLLTAIENFKPFTPAAASTPANANLANPAGATPSGVGQGGGVKFAEAIGVGSANALNAFSSEATAQQLEVRINSTLEAFRVIARTVAGHPGRKNLIWVSAAFPFSLSENAGVQDLSTSYVPGQPPALPNQGRVDAIAQGLEYQMRPEIQKAAAFLAESQVAVYPVDARGLLGGVLADATIADHRVLGGDELSRSIAASSQAQSSALDNMRDLAEQTGGRAYYNRNDIDHAVALASLEGTASYSLGYYTSNKKFNGEFRKIKVSVNRPGLQVRHRSGYFAYDPIELNKKKGAADAALQSAVRSDTGFNTLVLFDAQVLAPAPGSGAPVPITFLVNPKSITYEDAPDGGKKLNLDLYALAIGPTGNVVKNAGQTINTAVTADQFAKLQQQGLMVPMDVPIPTGSYTMKLVVRDNRTGYVGSLEAPLTVK